MKALEIAAKHLLALAAAVLLFRPGRRARASRQLAQARRILLVRVDDRVGEALLMTPLFTTLKGQSPPPRVEVLVHARAARVLDGHPHLDAVHPLDRTWLALGAWAPGLRPLRREPYDVVVDCANWEVPSVTSALVSRLAGPRAAVVGPAVWPVGALHDVPVLPKPGTRNELAQRLHLLSPLGPGAPTAETSFRAPRLSPAFEQDAARLLQGPCLVVNPGGRLDWRRVPAPAFAAAARAAAARGRTPVVTWGPGEEELAREVVALAPGARLAPATNLDELAWLMRRAGAVVCNNTGPMHLGVAAGAAVLAFFLRMEVERWGYPGAPHRMVDLTPDLGSEAALSDRAAREVDAFLALL